MDQKTIDEKIEMLRSELEETDFEIIQLFMMRIKLVKEIGMLKKEGQMDAFQLQEWERKVKLLKQELDGYPFETQVLELFDVLHEKSVEIQKSL